MAELALTQQELAARSGVSVATLRKVSAGNEQSRTRSTLASISRSLGLAEDHLWRVSRGERATSAAAADELSALRAEVASLAKRVEALENPSA
jgi:transcriptional regulator with XRE-family HTH domain